MFLLYILIPAVVGYLAYKAHKKAIKKAIHREQMAVTDYLFDQADLHWKNGHLVAGSTYDKAAWSIRQELHLKKAC